MGRVFKTTRVLNNGPYLKYWFNVPIICGYPPCHNLIIKRSAPSRYCTNRCRRMNEKLAPKEPYREEIRKCVECGSDYLWNTNNKDQKFCSQKPCKRNVIERRRYRKTQEMEPERAKRRSEMRNEYHRKWRAQNALDGRCTRCGQKHFNGNKLCSDCYSYLKAHEIRAKRYSY